MFLLSLKEKCFVLASLVQLYLSTIRRILLMSKAFCRNRYNSETEFQFIFFKRTGKDGAGGLKSREADQGRCDVLESQHKVRRGYHSGACPLIIDLSNCRRRCRSGTRGSSRTAPTASSPHPPLSRSTASVSQAGTPGTSATTSSGPSTRTGTATSTSESSSLLLTSLQVVQLKRS